MRLISQQKSRRSLAIHAFWFILTIATTTVAGAEWVCNVSFFSDIRPLNWSHLLQGLKFSVPFLLVLTVHEFGHYFVARMSRIMVSLPYYIPLWLGFLGIPSIGTAGAFIRIQSRIYTRVQYFDIGVAGPLAGFFTAILVLLYGFLTLPPATYIFSIHPEYLPYGTDYAQHVYGKEDVYLYFGGNLLFDFLKDIVADPTRLPHPYEMVHYPYLFAGYLSLFFTAINLLPIGQLDGGHVLYGLFGRRWHALISRIFFFLLLFYAGLGVLSAAKLSSFYALFTLGYLVFLYFCLKSACIKPWIRIIGTVLLYGTQELVAFLVPNTEGYSGWLLFAFLLGYVLGVDHPDTQYSPSLDGKRRLIAYLAIGIFIVCFSWKPFLLK